jgi:hypothetical protein
MDAAYDTAKSLPREAAARRLWTESSVSGWGWWKYLPLEASETDLDAYAVRHVDGLVGRVEGTVLGDPRTLNPAAAAILAVYGRLQLKVGEEPRPGSVNVPMTKPRSRNLLNSSRLV